MKLVTVEMLASAPRLYSQEDVDDPLVIAKFFQPWGGWTWFVTEMGPHEDDATEILCFGLVDGLEEELGYFLVSELEAIRGPAGLRIERDLYWKPVPLSQCYRAARHAGERTP